MKENLGFVLLGFVTIVLAITSITGGAFFIYKIFDIPIWIAAVVFSLVVGICLIMSIFFLSSDTEQNKDTEV